MTVYDVDTKVSRGVKCASIPIIDTSALGARTKSSEYKAQAHSLLQALNEYGFAQLINHGIQQQDLASMTTEALNFFEGSPEWHESCRRNESTSRGFADNELTKQKLDRKWIFDIGCDKLDETPKCDDESRFAEGPNQWPDEKELPHFKSTMKSYMKAMADFSLVLLEALEFTLGVEQGWFQQICDLGEHTSFLRLNYYPKASNQEMEHPGQDRMGIHDHKDAGLLTLLWQQEDICALQAWHPSSKAWIDVVPHPDALVLNAGDMLQVLTNDRVYAPPHRVVLPVEHRHAARLSAPYFYNPGFGATIRPQSVKDGEALYSPISWAHFRKRRIEGDFSDKGTEIQIEHFRKDES